MTVLEVAHAIGMSREFVYAEIRRGALAASHYGRSVRIEPADLAAYRARAKQRLSESKGAMALKHLTVGTK